MKRDGQEGSQITAPGWFSNSCAQHSQTQAKICCYSCFRPFLKGSWMFGSPKVTDNCDCVRAGSDYFGAIEGVNAPNGDQRYSRSGPTNCGESLKRDRR